MYFCHDKPEKRKVPSAKILRFDDNPINKSFI